MFGSTSRAFGSGGSEFAVDIVVVPSDWLMIKWQFDCHSMLFRRIWLLGLPITFALVSFISCFYLDVRGLAPSESCWFAFSPSWDHSEKLLSSCWCQGQSLLLRKFRWFANWLNCRIGLLNKNASSSVSNFAHGRSESSSWADTTWAWQSLSPWLWVPSSLPLLCWQLLFSAWIAAFGRQNPYCCWKSLVIAFYLSSRVRFILISVAWTGCQGWFPYSGRYPGRFVTSDFHPSVVWQLWRYAASSSSFEALGFQSLPFQTLMLLTFRFRCLPRPTHWACIVRLLPLYHLRSQSSQNQAHSSFFHLIR